MRDHDNELVLGHFLQQFHDLHRSIRIQSAGRFISQKDIRVVYQRAGNGHALHLPAGHLIGLLVQLIPKSHFFQRILCAGPTFRRADTGESQGKLHIGQNGLVRDQVIGLKNKAHRMISIGIPIAVAKVLGRLSVDHKVAGAVLIESADDV